MTKFWKQLEGWAIGLKNDPIFKIRFWVLAFSIISVLIILIFYNSFHDYHRNAIVVEELTSYRSDRSIDVLQVDVLARLEGLEDKTSIILTVVLVVAAFIFTYYIVKPIQKNLKAQRIFISGASHELRTPLANLRAVTEIALLDQENINKKKLISTLKSNLEEVDRFSDIIKTLLYLTPSPNTSLQKEIHFTEINLCEVVSRAKDVLGRYATSKRVKIKSYKNAEVVKVYGNSMSLEESIVNLLKNSLDHTNSGGKICISIQVLKKNGPVKFQIEDNGNGISKKDMPHIFEPFYKGSGVKNGSPYYSRNFGLGLSLVKETINKHNANIRIRSNLGKGTIVTIMFPKYVGASHSV